MNVIKFPLTLFTIYLLMTVTGVYLPLVIFIRVAIVETEKKKIFSFL